MRPLARLFQHFEELIRVVVQMLGGVEFNIHQFIGGNGVTAIMDCWDGGKRRENNFFKIIDVLSILL